jgi:putative aminopeptidase FrvX
VIPPLLDELLRARAPTGFEAEVAAVVRREASAFAEVSGDVHGSTTAVVRGTAGGGLLAVFAHCDEVGAMVSHVDADGFLSLHKLGDWSAGTLVDQRVEVIARSGAVPGVVSRRSTRGRPAWADLYVDIGAADEADALGLVALGDPVVTVGAPVELAAGRIASRACDNRVSLYAGLEALRLLAADPPPWDVALVASVQEERSSAGAGTTAFRLAPDAAIVLDVTWATDTPDASPHEHGHHPLGSGTAILRGPTVHQALAGRLVEAAQGLGDPFTIEVAERSLTDADVVYLAGAGVPSCVASIPMRRYHSPAETVQLSDVDACRRLVEAFARGLEPGVDLAR